MKNLPNGSEDRRHALPQCNRLRLSRLALVLLIWAFADLLIGQAPPMALAPEPQPSSSISGTILDTNGAALPGVNVTLTGPNGKGERSLSSRDDGEFTFKLLPAGVYKLTITSPGMERFASSDILLRAGEAKEMQHISLAVAGETTEVRVSVTQIELAQEQIKAAEQQRVLGILPNFYSSYILGCCLAECQSEV